MTTKLFATSILGLLLLSASAFSDEVRGVIDKVDAAKGEFSVTVRGRGPRGLVLSFRLAPDAQIHAGRQSTDLSDLRPGERARVYFETRDGQRVAVDVSVRRLLGAPRLPLENRKSCPRRRRFRRTPTPPRESCSESR